MYTLILTSPISRIFFVLAFCRNHSFPNSGHKTKYLERFNEILRLTYTRLHFFSVPTETTEANKGNKENNTSFIHNKLRKVDIDLNANDSQNTAMF